MTSRPAAPSPSAGFGDSLRADYDAGTAQVFGELGYRIDLGRVAFEPFAGLAYVNLHSDGFQRDRRRGGAVRLTGDDTSLGYSTLGLRASTKPPPAGHGPDPARRARLAPCLRRCRPEGDARLSGSNAFTVAGAPDRQGRRLVEAGLDLAISKSATLGVSYTGQLARTRRTTPSRACSPSGSEGARQS
jgi:fibronectin-binding autotransporter adhesin